MIRPEFSIEDRVWFIPNGAVFAVLATIIGVKRAINPGSFYFYELDEPVGHDVAEDELCLEKYRDCVEGQLEAETKEYPDGPKDIVSWRKRRVDFIYSTHVKAYGDKMERWPWMEEEFYPKRTKDELIVDIKIKDE